MNAAEWFLSGLSAGIALSFTAIGVGAKVLSRGSLGQTSLGQGKWVVEIGGDGEITNAGLLDPRTPEQRRRAS